MTASIGQTVFYNVLTPARLVSLSNIAGTYYNGPTNNGTGSTLTIAASSLTVDSVVVQLGDRVLLQAQTAAYQNGVYVVEAIGTAVILARAFDQQNTEQLKAGQFVFVGAGVINEGKCFCLVEPIPAHIGVDAITYIESSPAGRDITLPTRIGAIAVFTDTQGSLGMDGDPTTSEGPIESGANGFEGYFTSFPPTANNGFFRVHAQDAGGAFDTFLTNDMLTQTSTYILPAVSNTTVRLLAAGGTTPFSSGHFPVANGTNGNMVDSGAKIIAGDTAVWAGGGTTNNFVITGMNTSYVGVAVIKTSTNAVSVQKVTVGAGFVTVLFSADPGANTSMSYVFTSSVLV